MLASEQLVGDGIIFRGKRSVVIADKSFRHGGRRNRERLAAILLVASAALLLLLRRRVTGAMILSGLRFNRRRQKAGDSAMVRSHEPGRDREERDGG